MDIVRVVEELSTSGKNKAQLTVSPSASREVHWIEWPEFFSEFFSEFFKIIPNITTYHHLSPLQSGSTLILLSTSSRRMLMSCHSGTATDRDHSKWTGCDAAVVPIQ